MIFTIIKSPPAAELRRSEQGPDARTHPGDGEAVVYGQAPTRATACLHHSCAKSPTCLLIPLLFVACLSRHTGRESKLARRGKPSVKLAAAPGLNWKLASLRKTHQ